jgi:hypothetical protein
VQVIVTTVGFRQTAARELHPDEGTKPRVFHVLVRGTTSNSYDEKGWRATFYTTGREHSPTSATGTAWERTPWHATQRAAWEALRGRRSSGCWSSRPWTTNGGNGVHGRCPEAWRFEPKRDITWGGTSASRSRNEGRAITMSTWTKIAITLTVLGTIGIGVLPMIGRTTAPGGGISFRSAGWRSSWLVAWLVFLIGIALTAYVR